MKQLFLLVFIFLTLNLSKESDVTDALIDSVYDYLPSIIKGISSSNSTRCSKVFLNNKPRLLPLLKDVLADLENGATIFELGINYSFRVLGINGLLSDCKLYDLALLLDDIDSVNGIKKIGKAFQDYNKKLYDLERSIKNVKDLDDRLYYFGKIIYRIINFEFS